MNIHSMGAKLFNADGQTDRRRDTANLTAAFRNFTNTPKKSYILSTTCIYAFRIVSLNRTSRVVTIMNTKRIFCEVRNQFMYRPLIFN
jgi:hypothetical protein